ncbi:hypothetical protein CEXT_595251 [Caerostris extrusa]|uniref:Uncharacterized protein n=1 Tax=Caerostris extrusa TaxID=172846 RepID=A0AAV4RX17_CAEEX|nr:hypothetical protein CEXT_595251 [Caerostris extrusa]
MVERGICLISRCTGHRSMKRSFLVIQFQEEGLDREMEEDIPVGRRGVCCTFSPDPISRHFAPSTKKAGTKVLNVGEEAFISPNSPNGVVFPVYSKRIRRVDGRRHPRGKTRRLLHVLSRPHFAPFCSEVAGHSGKSLGTFWTAMIGP